MCVLGVDIYILDSEKTLSLHIHTHNYFKRKKYISLNTYIYIFHLPKVPNQQLMCSPSKAGCPQIKRGIVGAVCPACQTLEAKVLDAFTAADKEPLTIGPIAGRYWQLFSPADPKSVDHQEFILFAVSGVGIPSAPTVRVRISVGVKAREGVRVMTFFITHMNTHVVFDDMARPHHPNALVRSGPTRLGGVTTLCPGPKKS